MGTQIPAIAALPPSTCAKKLALDDLGDHVSTCTAHSGAKKAHDWAVEQITDLFQWCGDIELAAYLTDAAGPVPLVLDLRIAHKRWGSSSDPLLNGHLR